MYNLQHDGIRYDILGKEFIKTQSCIKLSERSHWDNTFCSYQNKSGLYCKSNHSFIYQDCTNVAALLEDLSQLRLYSLCNQISLVISNVCIHSIWCDQFLNFSAPLSACTNFEAILNAFLACFAYIYSIKIRCGGFPTNFRSQKWTATIGRSHPQIFSILTELT